MKILGIGVDIVKNQRIKSLVKNKNFIKRVFSKNEILNSKSIKNKIFYYSKRFAAKESFAKALGLGFRKGLNFKDIEILNDKFGKPYYNKNNKVNRIVQKTLNVKKFNLFLSIADEKDYSIAFTIIES